MNTTPIQSTRPETAPTSIRQPRFDLYGPIHKLMRADLTGLLLRMGKVDFANESAAARSVKELEDVLVACEKHIEHEVRFVHPHLAARLPNALVKIDAGHDDHERFVTELRAQMSAVTSAASSQLRELAGRTLYLHYNAFVADTLAHMVEEERVLQPLVHRFFTDEELLGIHGAIIASMSPEETFGTLGGMIPAVNRPGARRDRRGHAGGRAASGLRRRSSRCCARASTPKPGPSSSRSVLFSPERAAFSPERAAGRFRRVTPDEVAHRASSGVRP